MALELDAGRMLADAREIAFPRYPGTDGDRKAIEIVARQFREAGLRVVEETFSYDVRHAFLAIRLALWASALLVAAAGAASFVSAGLALALLLVALIAGGALIVWAPGAEKLYGRPGPTTTKNVSGIRPVDRPALRLLLMAHHDSKSQNLTFPFRMGLTLLAILGGLGLATVLLLTVVGGTAGPAWLAPALSGATVVALAILSTLSSGNRSPGGVDNAGSLSIVFELARRLPALVSDDIELVFLSTGAEEDHMVGAMRWLEEHRAELEACPTYALNFDGAGAPGKTVLIERYGLGRLFSARLSALAREAAAELQTPFRAITMLPAMGVDAIPFAHHGVDCLTFSSGSLDRATMSVHSSADVAENLDGPTLERVARLGLETARRLAASAS